MKREKIAFLILFFLLIAHASIILGLSALPLPPQNNHIYSSTDTLLPSPHFTQTSAETNEVNVFNEIYKVYRNRTEAMQWIKRTEKNINIMKNMSMDTNDIESKLSHSKQFLILGDDYCKKWVLENCSKNSENAKIANSYYVEAKELAKLNYEDSVDSIWGGWKGIVSRVIFIIAIAVAAFFALLALFSKIRFPWIRITFSAIVDVMIAIVLIVWWLYFPLSA